MSPPQERNMEKGRIIKPRVTKLMKIYQRMDAIMDLIVGTWEKLHRNRKVTLNDFLRKVLKYRGQKIEMTVLNGNVTLYQIF